MRYRIISTTYGDDVLNRYPELDYFKLESTEEIHWTHKCEDPADYRTYLPNAFDSYMTDRYYITIEAMEEFEKLMQCVNGRIVVDNHHVYVEYRGPRDSGRWYSEPTIEIYDGPREEDDADE